MAVLGIDIGGSGIKGALVDVENGQLVTERHRIPTPEEARPDDVADTVKAVVEFFKYTGPVGFGFPSVVQHGVVYTAANIHKTWVGVNAEELFGKASLQPVFVLNDADAAGIAEMKFGAGKDEKGVVIALTIGTGIGSAIFSRGILVPNTEFGHLTIRGKDAEKRASDAARQKKGRSFEEWAVLVQEFLVEMEKLFSPDLFIIGGGVSRHSDKFFPYLKTRARMVPAQLLNQAGIVGAAMYAYQESQMA